MKKWYSLIDKVYRMENLEKAYKAVKANNGAPGVDGVTVEAYGLNLQEELNKLHHQLKTGSYEPDPVLRVEIPKADGSKRPLGIPTVRDRVAQQALLNIMQPIFEPDFHPSSYGYRPGRSCHQAVAKAEMFINKYGLSHVVDMDLSKCFDRLDHELILEGVNRKISDGSVLKLIKKFLGAGVMKDGVWEETDLGSPQGGVISPLLSNIYLDKEKTHLTDNQKGVTYLGFVIYDKQVSISPKKLKAFKENVRKMTPRNHGMNVEEMIRRLNPILRGWANYFRVANCRGVFSKLMGWIRRRLRMKKMKEWKRWQALHKALRRKGYKGKFEKISMTTWRNSASPLISMALPNKWFDEIGLINLEKYNVGILHHYQK